MRDIPGLMRKQATGNRTPLSNVWSPPPLSPRNEWDAGYFGRNIPDSGRFCEVDDYPLPRSTPFRDAAFQAPSPTATRSPFAEQQVPFEQAAANIHAALQHACRECPKIEMSFNEQVQRLTTWLPSQLVDSLWTIFLDWNGIPLQQQQEGRPGVKPHATSSAPSMYPSFNDIAKRFTKALDALKMSAPPRCFTSGESDSTAASFGTADVNFEILRTTMRKLQISLEAIEALMGSVRSHRDRMAPMVKEMNSAVSLLDGVRDVWGAKEKRPAAAAASSSSAIPTSQMGRRERVCEFWGDSGEI